MAVVVVAMVVAMIVAMIVVVPVMMVVIVMTAIVTMMIVVTMPVRVHPTPRRRANERRTPCRWRGTSSAQRHRRLTIRAAAQAAP